MNLQRFLATWARLTLEDRVNRLIILLLIGVNDVLAVTVNQTDRTVCWCRQSRKGRSR
jgi:conjugal transfer pilus assembly protein TraE